eukprot:EG_transcript_1435
MPRAGAVHSHSYTVQESPAPSPKGPGTVTVHPESGCQSPGMLSPTSKTGDAWSSTGPMSPKRKRRQRFVLDCLSHKWRAVICIMRSYLARKHSRLCYKRCGPNTFAEPTVFLRGLAPDEARDRRNAALRVTAAPRIQGITYTKLGTTETLDLPVEITETDHVLIDFGAVTRAQVELLVNCPGKAAVVCIGLCERLEGSQANGDRFIAQLVGEGKQAPTVVTLSNGSAALSSAIGTFRYVAVSAKSGSFLLKGSETKSTLPLEVPFGTPYVGNFRCSCPHLTRVWYAGVNTLELCTDGVPRVFLDGSKRDRWVWTGDLFVEQLVAYISNGDVRSAVNSLAAVAEFQEPDGYVPHMAVPKDSPDTTAPQTLAKTLTFAEYCVWYVIVVWLHYLHTGDESFAREFEAVVEKAMAWLCRRVTSHGLIEVSSRDGQTWHTPELVLGCPTDLNCLMVYAFECANKLRQAVNKPQNEQWVAMRAVMTEAINAHLWDEKTGAYLNSDAANSVPTQDSNSSAVWTEVATPDQARRSLQYLEREQACDFGVLTAKEDHVTMTSYISPFASFRHLLAMAQVGDTEGTLRLIRKLWVHMAETDPENVFWEKVSPDGKVQSYNQIGRCQTYTSLCHGWSAGPSYVLSTMLLGVTPTSPGYATAAVKPLLGDLDWVDGVVPTPHGGIAVTWQRQGDRHCLLRVDLPANVQAVVTFPLQDVAVWQLQGGTSLAPVRDPEAMRLTGPVTVAWVGSPSGTEPPAARLSFSL